jgi:hypothetical protein|tara:strand:- start:245 stop:415 length:171 start_codon:yes stop_codon:yes gene_type:complete
MKEIKMPIYYIINDEANPKSESNEKVYDYEEMALELRTKIKETLNRNVVVIIEEIE